MESAKYEVFEFSLGMIFKYNTQKLLPVYKIFTTNTIRFFSNKLPSCMLESSQPTLWFTSKLNNSLHLLQAQDILYLTYTSNTRNPITKKTIAV